MLATCGSQFPDQHGYFGAPFSVGQSCGWNILFGCETQFLLPLWLLDAVVTLVPALALGVLLKGRLWPGLITTTVAVLIAFGLVILLPGTELRSNPIVVWIWMLVALATVWGIRRRTS